MRRRSSNEALAAIPTNALAREFALGIAEAVLPLKVGRLDGQVLRGVLYLEERGDQPPVALIAPHLAREANRLPGAPRRDGGEEQPDGGEDRGGTHERRA